MVRAQLVQPVNAHLNCLAVLGRDVVDRDGIVVLLGHDATLCATAPQTTMQAMKGARTARTTASKTKARNISVLHS